MAPLAYPCLVFASSCPASIAFADKQVKFGRLHLENIECEKRKYITNYYTVLIRPPDIVVGGLRFYRGPKATFFDDFAT